MLRDPAIRKLAAEIARRSVLIGRDRHGLLPLSTDQRILVVEQKVKDYNDMDWHSGILYENCLKYCRGAEYLETAYSWDESDRERIFAAAEQADILVVTSYFLRGTLSNRDAISELIRTCGKPVIVVSNTPFEEISIPENAQTVVITFATSPENVKVTAGTLFGTVHPEGSIPVSCGIGSK